MYVSVKSGVQVWESTLVIVGISDSTGTCDY